jgi:Xaa-Pro aminopeptidase
MKRDEILTRLRYQMKMQKVDALVIPSSDPHQGEYIPAHYQCRQFVSGFHGSAGTVVITAEDAGLWTDGRYFAEAEEALRGTTIALYRLHTSGTPDYPEWLTTVLPPGSAVGVDPRVVTIAWEAAVRKTLETCDIRLVPIQDPFADIWEDRPPVPTGTITVHPAKYATEETVFRLQRLRHSMMNTGAGIHLVSTLDDIAWALNLRGTDIPFNPVFLAYMVVERARVRVYIDDERLSNEVMEHLKKAGVRVYPYRMAFPDLAELESCDGPILLDRERTSWAVARSNKKIAVIYGMQPSTAMKARKTEAELAHIRTAMVRDGHVMVRFLSWIDELTADPERWKHYNEMSLARELNSLRAEDPHCVSESFETISGINGNGAIIHYRVQEKSAAPLTRPGVYLVDSGGQYLDGTTDITRTVYLGHDSHEEIDRQFPHLREDYTAVLQGHIALACLIMPVGTSGRDIDVVARQHLWRRLRNYPHGTGHGVGYHLNVHEGPQRISQAGTEYPLDVGMVVSNEPGVYRPELYGIRLENLLTVVADKTGDFGPFLSFNTLTLCPFDRRLIKVSMLTAEERKWVDSYHQDVRDELSGGLSTREISWLVAATAPLT